MTSERCLRCDWWDHGLRKCYRIFKATIRVAEDGGEIRLETQPGLLPQGMEAEFSAWLVGALGDYIVMDKLLKDKNIPVDKKLAMASKLVLDIINNYTSQVKEKQI